MIETHHFFNILVNLYYHKSVSIYHSKIKNHETYGNYGIDCVHTYHGHVVYECTQRTRPAHTCVSECVQKDWILRSLVVHIIMLIIDFSFYMYFVHDDNSNLHHFVVSNLDLKLNALKYRLVSHLLQAPHQR